MPITTIRRTLARAKRAAVRALRDRLIADEPTVAGSGRTLHESEAYPGYDATDVARLEILRDPAPADGRAGFVTDFIGGVMAVDMIPGAEQFDGAVIDSLPIPSDGLHAETAEYAALALAFQHADGARFQLFELGAGWAPWMVNAGLVARRKGYDEIRLLGIEADDTHLAYAIRNLTDNGLRPAGDAGVTELDGVRCEVLHGAIWWEDTQLHFPTDGDSMDYGMAAQTDATGTDYRGVPLTQRPVRAFGLAALLDEHGIVDLLHVDIQGSEYDVLSKSLDALNRSVRVMCVGTHSRPIEGDLLTLLHAGGWRLHDEKPCKFVYAATAPTLEGMTVADGVQTWVNPRLTAPDGG